MLQACHLPLGAGAVAVHGHDGAPGQQRRLAAELTERAIGGKRDAGGLEVAAACDMRVASNRAVFGMPEVKVGIPSVVEAALLPHLIGWGRTRELLLCGETIDAATAER